MGEVAHIADHRSFRPIKGVEVCMKTCAKCLVSKPATSEFFSTSVSAEDGLHSYCRPCNVEYQRDYRIRKRDGLPTVMEERAGQKLAQLTKVCTECQRDLPKSEFYSVSERDQSLDGLKSACKQCSRSRVQKSARARDWAERMVAAAKRRHTNYWPESEFDLTPEFLREIYQKQNGLCFWFEIELHLGVGAGLQQASLDRADCSRGYTKDNVLLSSKAANLARGDAPTDEFTLLIQRIRAVKEEG